MKRRIGFLILLSVVSLFSITGIVLASDGKPSSYSEKIEAKLQAAVDAGKLTQEQADAKLQAIADGKTGKKKKMKRATVKRIEAKLQAAVDAGKLTQEQADAKIQAIADGKTRMKKGNHWHKKGFGNFKGKLGKGSRT